MIIKVYGKVLKERLTSNRETDAEQQAFWKDRGCVDQIFMKTIFEKYLQKGRRHIIG